MSVDLPKFTKTGFKVRFVLLLLFASLGKSNAQVQNRAFQFVLRNLLSHTVPEVSVPELTKNPSAYPVLLDARSWREYEISHLKGAIWVGYEDFELSRVLAISKETSILVYCSVGYRSEKIAEKLLGAGYKHPFNLYGGIFEWVNQKQALVDLHGRPTKQIHAYNKIWGTWARVKKNRKVYG